MTRTAGIVFLLALVMAVAPLGLSTQDESPGALKNWFEKLPQAKEKLTELHFFIHDIVSGKNPSIVPVARASMTPKSPTSFGIVNVVDDLLTEGADIRSKRIGHIQGTYISASQENVSLFVGLNVVFEFGKFNGSTLSVLGRIAEFADNREFPIVGGTGRFTLARGIFTATIHSADKATGNRIVECHGIALHY